MKENEKSCKERACNNDCANCDQCHLCSFYWANEIETSHSENKASFVDWD